MTTPAPAKPDTPGPSPVAAPPTAGSPPLRLQVVSNGDPAGTQLVDGAGNPVTFVGCHGRLDVRVAPGHAEARAVLVFEGLPVQVQGNPPPFTLHGVSVGDLPGPMPAGLTEAPLAGVAPVVSAGAGAHPSTGAAVEQARRFNEGR